ncbi:unnamed protein product [Closterium sp. NIES-53]
MAMAHGVPGHGWLSTRSIGIYPKTPQPPRPIRSHPTLRAAAGNSGVEVPGGGTVSGMAPKAWLAIYKVYWHQDKTTIMTGLLDVFAAIDQAVVYGVDLLTLSVDKENENDYEHHQDEPKGTYFDDVPFLSALAVGVGGMLGV